MVQTTYDIIKAHGGEIKVETKLSMPARAIRWYVEQHLSFNYPSSNA